MEFFTFSIFSSCLRTSPQRLIASAETALQRGKYDWILERARKILDDKTFSSDPAHRDTIADVHYFMGKAYFMKGDDSLLEAHTSLTECLNVKAFHIEALLARARARSKLKLFDDAIGDLIEIQNLQAVSFKDSLRAKNSCD